MKTIMSVIRTVLGWIMMALDYITRPTPVQRSPDEQEVIENELEKMSLYQFDG
jgi:mRNA degradation ribonuclease J1/J2